MNLDRTASKEHVPLMMNEKHFDGQNTNIMQPSRKTVTWAGASASACFTLGFLRHISPRFPKVALVHGWRFHKLGGVIGPIQSTKKGKPRMVARWVPSGGGVTRNGRDWQGLGEGWRGEHAREVGGRAEIWPTPQLQGVLRVPWGGCQAGTASSPPPRQGGRSVENLAATGHTKLAAFPLGQGMGSVQGFQSLQSSKPPQPSAQRHHLH